MIKILDKAEVEQLIPVLKDEAWERFGRIDHADLLAEMDDEELIAFIPLENVILIPGVYVTQNNRGERGHRAIMRLVNRIRRSARQSGRSFLMTRHEDRADHFAGLSSALGFYKFADVVYRTDRFRRD
jgi:hypothetical protein